MTFRHPGIEHFSESAIPPFDESVFPYGAFRIIFNIPSVYYFVRPGGALGLPILPGIEGGDHEGENDIGGAYAIVFIDTCGYYLSEDECQE